MVASIEELSELVVLSVVGGNFVFYFRFQGCEPPPSILSMKPELELNWNWR